MLEFLFSIMLYRTNDISFKDVQPIFQNRCIRCHYSGHWDWTKYENAQRYKDRIRWRVWDTRSMPPGGYPITEDERKKIRDWVDQGAKQ